MSYEFYTDIVHLLKNPSRQPLLCCCFFLVWLHASDHRLMHTIRQAESSFLFELQCLLME